MSFRDAAVEVLNGCGWRVIDNHAPRFRADLAADGVGFPAVDGVGACGFEGRDEAGGIPRTESGGKAETLKLKC
jgi:hypothetical protein